MEVVPFCALTTPFLLDPVATEEVFNELGDSIQGFELELAGRFCGGGSWEEANLAVMGVGEMGLVTGD